MGYSEIDDNMKSEVSNDLGDWFRVGDVAAKIMENLERGCMKLVLPLPPSLNEMIALAKQRSKGGLPIVYDGKKSTYNTMCDVWSRSDGIFPPREAWGEWKLVSARFYVHNERDPIELLSGLKWPVDWLVKRGFVANDSPRELKAIPYPEQQIDRKKQRIELELEAA